MLLFPDDATGSYEWDMRAGVGSRAADPKPPSRCRR